VVQAQTACNSNPCQNGGSCANGAGSSYTCNCPAGTVGAQCQIVCGTVCGPGTTSCGFDGVQVACYCARGYTATSAATCNVTRSTTQLVAGFMSGATTANTAVVYNGRSMNSRNVPSVGRIPPRTVGGRASFFVLGGALSDSVSQPSNAFWSVPRPLPRASPRLASPRLASPRLCRCRPDPPVVVLRCVAWHVAWRGREYNMDNNTYVRLPPITASEMGQSAVYTGPNAAPGSRFGESVASVGVADTAAVTLAPPPSLPLCVAVGFYDDPHTAASTSTHPHPIPIPYTFTSCSFTEVLAHLSRSPLCVYLIAFALCRSWAWRRGLHEERNG
jgi:hypothetical protein